MRRRRCRSPQCVRPRAWGSPVPPPPAHRLPPASVCTILGIILGRGPFVHCDRIKILLPLPPQANQMSLRYGFPKHTNKHSCVSSHVGSQVIPPPVPNLYRAPNHVGKAQLLQKYFKNSYHWPPRSPPPIVSLLSSSYHYPPPPPGLPPPPDSPNPPRETSILLHTSVRKAYPVCPF